MLRNNSANPIPNRMPMPSRTLQRKQYSLILHQCLLHLHQNEIARRLRALACGRPLLVSDDGWFRELPDDCAVKVDIGEDEVDSIARALAQLAAEPDRRAAMSSAALSYAAPLDPESRAEAYRRFVTTGVENSLRHDLAPAGRGLVREGNEALWRFPHDYPQRARAITEQYSAVR